MKNINGFLVGIVLLFISCKKEETIPEVSMDEFFIEFVVNGKEKVAISQQLDPAVQVHGYSTVTYRNHPALPKKDYKIQIGSQESGVNIFFTHNTNKTTHPVGGNRYTEDLLQHIRKKVLESPIKFAPVDDTDAFAFKLEFGDTRFTHGYLSYNLGLIDGTISPISADQQGSRVTITNHHPIKLKAYFYEGFDVEQIEGTFNMKLYSHVDTISVTEGKFKLFMILN